MNKSEFFKFNLPNRDNSEDLADVNKISENFIIADSVLREHEEALQEKVDGELTQNIDENSTENQVPSAKAVNERIKGFAPSVDSSFSYSSKNPVENRVISKNVASVIKVYAEGNPIAITDVSPLEHEIMVSVDVGGATLTAQGKNLFDKNATQYSGTCKSMIDGENLVVTTTNTNGYVSANFVIPNGEALVGKQVTIFGEWEASGENNGTLRIQWTRADNKHQALGTMGAATSISGASATKVIPTKPDGAGELCLLVYGNNTGTGAVGATVTYKNIQIEISDVATEYEPYIEPIPYTTDENGNVAVPSIYPTTTLIAENGVTISAEYNADTKKYIDKKFAELAAVIVNS